MGELNFPYNLEEEKGKFPFDTETVSLFPP